jgi:hypothetical protein
MRKLLLPALLAGLIARTAHAADIGLSIEVPRLDVAEYHRPYVAIWIENPDQSVAADLAVWYDVAKKNNEGTEWLKDLRQWWRKSGRELTMPVDGLTGATRAPGEHQVGFGADRGALASLQPGEYLLVVEAAREVGGRELLRLPFSWPPKAPATSKAAGATELGAVTLTVKP